MIGRARARRDERKEQKILDSIDVIMLQVRRELGKKVEPGTIDLVTVELHIRSLCTLTAALVAQTLEYGADKGDAHLWRRKSKEHVKAVLEVTHGGKNEAFICVIIEMAVAEAFYFQTALKPDDIKLGTHLEEYLSE
ncbi:unnamed protein product [Clonostachys rosea f. rosea IK726]|uniref:Uncharacterized protein n=1 Tax=Clonostachys rosea f. rosea IK726 TaxID=1349383 RepID=A0ACA9TM56_BIOOC|nr:unnamed protein product [Clonostachys rosea f. rosea IK726]